MVDGIIEDIKKYNDRAIVKKTDKEICIHKENSTTTYFYSPEDRKERLLRFIDG
jgi:hypothetical protein